MRPSTVIRRRRLPVEPLSVPGLSAVLSRVYAARGIRDPNDLELSLRDLAGFQSFLGMDRAVALLEQALRERKRILIVGDFDADGATSSALAVRALRAFGAHEVDYLVPNRFEYGYGLTPQIVEVAAARQPDLLITVDNGISSFAGVAAARAAEIRVLITDHHLPGSELPEADAIVNPNVDGDGFPSKHLAGVGVIFYVLSALRARLRESGWFYEQALPVPSMGEWLDLVAIGTIADVVSLDRNNRILIEQGLRRIRAGQTSAGIAALIAVSGRARERLLASDVAFALAPRLNAAGRLEDMSIGIESLLCDDIERSRALAGTLDGLNRDRREIEAQMQAQALRALEQVRLRDSDSALVLYDPGWHQGVIGILAGRLKERFHRPAIVFANGEGGELKGSARSIAGLHMRDALDAVATRHAGLLERFGGHAMAAGLSLAPAQLERFRDAFTEEVGNRLSEEDLERSLLTDGELAPDELVLETAEALRQGGPWGQGFPEPRFDGEFHIEDRRIVGGGHLKLRVRPRRGRRTLDAIFFRPEEGALPEDCERARLVYRLDVNEWQDTRTAQLVVEHCEPL
jgi:single-stranded-DNA-specific exonuclease